MTLEEAIQRGVADGVRAYLHEIRWKPDSSNRFAPGLPPHLMPEPEDGRSLLPSADAVSICVDALNTADVPPEFGRDKAREVLISAGLPGFATKVLDVALVQRRRALGLDHARRPGRPPSARSEV